MPLSIWFAISAAMAAMFVEIAPTQIDRAAALAMAVYLALATLRLIHRGR